MLDIKDINYQPNINEIINYVKNSLFNEFYNYIIDTYKAICKIEYSKDVYKKGWNLKLRKSGKSLCTVYPREKIFTVLIVVSQKEKERVEDLLPTFSSEVKKIYYQTKEGNGQRWLMIDLNFQDNIYQDVLSLIKIRRESK